MNIPQTFNDYKVYEKFFVHKVSLEFVPNQPVTVGGNITMAPDYDPLDPAPATIASLSASFGFVRKPITQRAVCNMPNFKLPDGAYMRPALFTGPGDNDRFASYGKFVVDATSLLDDGVSVGSLILHWDITFCVKQPLSTSDLSESTVAKSIKFTADTGGTIVANSVRNSTKLDEIEVFDITHAAASAIDHTKIYSGIITALTDVVVSTVAGQSVNPGTRIFYKGTKSVNDGTTVSPDPLDSAFVGELSLSRTFDALMALKINRSIDGFIDLAKVRWFS